MFEAASWALAARRLTPEARANRWLEPLPAVELADRLRRLPLFKFTSIDELFRIAEHRPAGAARAGQRHLRRRPPGHGPGVPARPHRHADRARRLTEELTGPATIGFDEVFEGVAQKATAKAAGIAISLSLPLEAFLGLLSESTELAQGIFRQLLDEPGGGAWRRVISGVVHAPSAARLRDGLQPIEKVLVLEEMPVFSRATSDQLAALAGIAREVKIAEGDVLFREADAPAIHMVLEGELSLEPMAGGEPMHVAAGDAVGVYETLGRTRGRRLARSRDARRRRRSASSVKRCSICSPIRSICCRGSSARCSARASTSAAARRPWPAGSWPASSALPYSLPAGGSPMLRRALAGAALLALVVVALPRGAAGAGPCDRPQRPPGPGSKIWLGHEAEFEEFLRTAKIAKSSEVKVGVTHPHHCYFEPGGLAAGAVFKPLPAGTTERVLRELPIGDRRVRAGQDPRPRHGAADRRAEVQRADRLAAAVGRERRLHEGPESEQRSRHAWRGTGRSTGGVSGTT